MCNAGTCRPCRLEDRLLDRAMGSARVYGKATLNTREQNEAKRKVITTNPLEGVRRKSNSKPVFNANPLTSRVRESQPKKRPVRNETGRTQARAAKRKAARTLIDGRLVSDICPEHGTPSSYKAWHCRCEPCKDAFLAARNESVSQKLHAL